MGLFDWEPPPYLPPYKRGIFDVYREREPKKPKKLKNLKPGKRAQEIAAKILEKVKQNERRPETSPLSGPRYPNGMGHHDRRHDQ